MTALGSLPRLPDIDEQPYNRGEQRVMKNFRALAVAFATVVATAALLASGTPAEAKVFDFSNNTNARDVSWNGTTVRVRPVVDRDHKASYAHVKDGRLHVQARAQCQRRNGGTAWYQSTIRVGAGGGSSHYDCDNNGTYNRAIVGLGLDIN